VLVITCLTELVLFAQISILIDTALEGLSTEADNRLKFKRCPILGMPNTLGYVHWPAAIRAAWLVINSKAEWR
jgi:hypothetical protein